MDVDWKAVFVGLRSLENIVWVTSYFASRGARSMSIVTGRHSGLGVPETQLSIQHVGKASKLSAICMGHIVT